MNTSEFNLVVKATLSIYLDAAKQAFREVCSNWIIIAASILAYTVYKISASILAPFDMVGGMLLGLIQIALLSMYYSWINQTYRKHRLTLDKLIQFDLGLFLGLINVAFILWIVLTLLQAFVRGFNYGWTLSLVNLAVVLVFNAIPEVVHIQRVDGTHAFAQAAEFTYRNWIEWYLPFSLIILPWIVISPQLVPLILASSHPLLPVFIVVTVPAILFPGASVVTQILGLILATWFMVFRAHLFDSLESGTRRRRIFEAKQR